MKEQFPNLHISLNGGIKSLKAANELLSDGIDGVMIGRSAYQQPSQVLLDADQIIFEKEASKSQFDIATDMRQYLKLHLSNGGKPHQVTRHMTGLFHGFPGSKIWKQILSKGSSSRDIDFYDEAILAVSASINKFAA